MAQDDIKAMCRHTISSMTLDHLFQTVIAPLCTTFSRLNRLGFADDQCRKDPSMIKSSAEDINTTGMILHL